MKKAILTGMSLLVASVASAGIYDELSPAQQNQVQNGQQVFVTTPVAGNAWPMITVYQRLDAGADETAAVFWDFPRYSEYFKKVMLNVQVASRPAATIANVNYELAMPFFMPNDHYLMENRLSQTSAGYTVKWKMIGESKYSKSAMGSLRMETLGTGTLIAFQNLVSPKMSTDGIKEKGMQQARNTVTQLIQSVYRIRITPLMQTQLQALRAALGQ